MLGALDRAGRVLRAVLDRPLDDLDGFRRRLVRPKNSIRAVHRSRRHPLAFVMDGPCQDTRGALRWHDAQARWGGRREAGRGCGPCLASSTHGAPLPSETPQAPGDVTRRSPPTPRSDLATRRLQRPQVRGACEAGDQHSTVADPASVRRMPGAGSSHRGSVARPSGKTMRRPRLPHRFRGIDDTTNASVCRVTLCLDLLCATAAARSRRAGPGSSVSCRRHSPGTSP